MFDKPSYLIQVGHHGKNRVYDAIEGDHLDGAILSPTDYKPEVNKELANSLNSEDLVTLFDPHLYLPGQGDRKDLNEYEYHEKYGGEDYTSGVLFDTERRDEFLKLVIEAQDDYDTNAYLSPSSYLGELSAEEIDDWQDFTEAFLEIARSEGRDIPVYLSLPVNGDRLTNLEIRNQLMDSATELDTDGFYVSVSYSDRDTRLPLQGVEKVTSYLELMATLRVNRYNVIAAHTHQIAHLLFAIGVNAVGSGHYKNLRSFDTERWIVPDETQIRTPVIRYYSDELLTSIRPDSLLDELYKEPGFDEEKIRTKSPYESDLFDGSVTPANTGWGKAEGSWDHYVWACDHIASSYEGKNLPKRVEKARSKIRRAKALYKQISTEIDEYVDEIESDIYDDWETSLDEIANSDEFKRLKRLV
ncbi:hypothetical protein [Halorarum halobium]|uniref:hypothetical protein n=1 Tax=Halorarum halobium TaxID=3075121 RepID=UPI0028A9EDCA|nr:hypothetical protein [Halobaculum sp. XH14]